MSVAWGDYHPSAYRVPAQGMRSTFMSVEIAHATITAAGHVGLPEWDPQGGCSGNGMGLLQGVRAGEAVTAIEDAWTG